MAARSMLKTKAYVATKVSTERQSWATTCSLVGVWVPSSHQNHSHDLNDLFFYPEPDAVQTPAAAKDHVFAHAPAVAGDYADICDMYHLRGHRNNVWWNQKFMLSQPCSSLALRSLVLLLNRHCSKRADSNSNGRAMLPLGALRRDGLHLTPQVREICWHGSKGSGSTPHLTGAASVAQTDQHSYHLGIQQGLGLALPSIPHPCWSSWRNCSWEKTPTGSPWLLEAVGYLKRVLVSVQWWWCTRNQRPWTKQKTLWKTKDSLRNLRLTEVASKADWTKGHGSQCHQDK